MVRYPGGNFVSGYRWEDGVGPVEQRPRRLDLAWHSTESNEFGARRVHALGCARSACEPMLAVNLGTRGVHGGARPAGVLQLPGGTALPTCGRRNGRAEPYACGMWCLGNEMDGPWQIGHSPADEYGRLAARDRAGHALVDPRPELVACGSLQLGDADLRRLGARRSSSTPTTWSTTSRATPTTRSATATSAASWPAPPTWTASSRRVVATCDHVEAARGARKRIEISFDEWNVWYMTRFDSEEQPARRLAGRAAAARRRLHGRPTPSSWAAC